ncbi:hypothetical protein AT959_00125 [Dechloromonas denitrificans]|uniref:Peptidase M48 domain-containing protein n=1 Tax=Dechloromonas denitrificans TaxID=281362 RepID=A0A133XNZ3_9RHOO|nr:M48 family metallopeptidase [Dechloromonas denitrificans]KXB32650.1 hypothetical protein AT959_00125 [Dechloromonas denitrificans]
MMIRCYLLLALALALAGCASQGGFSKAGIPLLDAPGSKQPVHTQLAPGKYEASIMAIGSDHDLARERGQNLGFVNNRGLKTWLKGIRERLLAVSGITDVPGTVQITANTTYAAYATADGNVMISIAWLTDIESEDEIAAIIAHEISHVLLKHQATDVIGLTQKRLQSMHEMLVGGRMSATRATQLGKADSKALLAAQLSVKLVDTIIMPAWNRRQETEADLLGLDLMIKAGYSPEGMQAMLERLRSSERKSRLAEEAMQQRLKEIAARDPAKAVQTAIDTFVSELASKHPETDQRLDGISEYQERHYDLLQPPKLTITTLKKIRTTRDIGPVLANYQHVARAKNRLEQGKVKEAYSEAVLGAQKPTAMDALPNWILWKTAVAYGKQQQHKKALEIALNSPEPIPDIYNEVIRYNEEQRNYQAALGFANKASEVFGDDPTWTPVRIRLLTRLGRKNEAQGLVLQCSVKTPQIRKECYDATKS